MPHHKSYFRPRGKKSDKMATGHWESNTHVTNATGNKKFGCSDHYDQGSWNPENVVSFSFKEIYVWQKIKES